MRGVRVGVIGLFILVSAVVHADATSGLVRQVSFRQIYLDLGLADPVYEAAPLETPDDLQRALNGEAPRKRIRLRSGMYPISEFAADPSGGTLVVLFDSRVFPKGTPKEQANRWAVVRIQEDDQAKIERWIDQPETLRLHSPRFITVDRVTFVASRDQVLDLVVKDLKTGEQSLLSKLWADVLPGVKRIFRLSPSLYLASSTDRNQGPISIVRMDPTGKGTVLKTITDLAILPVLEKLILNRQEMIESKDGAVWIDTEIPDPVRGFSGSKSMVKIDSNGVVSIQPAVGHGMKPPGIAQADHWFYVEAPTGGSALWYFVLPRHDGSLLQLFDEQKNLVQQWRVPTSGAGYSRPVPFEGGWIAHYSSHPNYGYVYLGKNGEVTELTSPQFRLVHSQVGISNLISQAFVFGFGSADDGFFDVSYYEISCAGIF